MRDNGKVLASQDVTLEGRRPDPERDAGVQRRRRRAEVARDRRSSRSRGEDNTANNNVSRLVNVENRKPRILYFEGEPRWEYKFIRRALDDYRRHRTGRAWCAPRRTSSIASSRRGIGEKELEDGFPTKAEDLFEFQGLIIGSVEASYFTPAQQQLIHDFVDRRGGGLLFLGGRATLSDGGYPEFAAGRPGADQTARRARAPSTAISPGRN